MAFYAVVVVLEEPEDESAYRRIAQSTDVVFVGEPWEVKPLKPGEGPEIEPNDEPEFDTTYCLLQRCTL